MEYYTAEEKVIKLMESNPTIPSEAFEQLVDEKFGITNQYFSCNQEVEELKRYRFDFMRNTGVYNTDPQRELDFENRQGDEE